MKKILLSLSALFAVSLASAQSYPKQPDRTIVEYVEYQKPAAEEPALEAKDVDKSEVKNTQAKQEAQPAAKKEDDKIQKATNPAVLNNKKGVAVNESK